MYKSKQLTVLVLLALMFSFSSCSDDDPVDPEPIDIRDRVVGRYSYEEVLSYEDGTEEKINGFMNVVKSDVATSIGLRIIDSETQEDALAIEPVNMKEVEGGITFEIVTISSNVAGETFRVQGLPWKELNGTMYEVVYDDLSGRIYLSTTLFIDDVKELTNQTTLFPL